MGGRETSSWLYSAGSGNGDLNWIGLLGERVRVRGR
jgi:hypothetical protein